MPMGTGLPRLSKGEGQTRPQTSRCLFFRQQPAFPQGNQKESMWSFVTIVSSAQPCKAGYVGSKQPPQHPTLGVVTKPACPHRLPRP